MKNNAKMAQLLTAYKAQTGQIMKSFGPSYGQIYENISAPVLINPYADDIFMKHDSGVGTTNDVDIWGSEGGLFADCCIDNPVMSLLYRPLRGLGSLIPVRADNNEVVKRAYITGDYSLIDSRPSDVCEAGPTVGAMDACFAEFRKGRVSYSSKTAELDELIKNACIGVNTNRFYLVNAVRGTSGPVPQMGADQDNSIFSMALMREMHFIANRMNMDLMKQFWAGDPSNNTVGGGYKEFVGLDLMIVDDYGDGKNWVSGTGDCENLNSDVKTFNARIGEANASGYYIYDLLQELMFELSSRADGYGSMVDWVIVMPRIIWHKLTEFLPCEMMSAGCASSTSVSVVSNDNYQARARDEMRRSQTLDINGMTFPVLIDEFIPVVETDNLDGTFDYTSDIYVIPLRVNGEVVLEWTHADYRAFNQALQGIPAGISQELRGWSDDGRMHHVIQRNLRCFIVDVKTEMGLIFTAPHLAGRVSSVKAYMAQKHMVTNTVA